MATYVYGCEPCQFDVEVSHPMKDCDTYAINCPRCERRMSRVPQAAGMTMAFRAGYFPQLETTIGTQAQLNETAARKGFDVHKTGW